MPSNRLLPLVLIAGAGCALAQETPPPDQQVHELAERPVFRVDVVERVTIAVNYRHRSGPTRIDFRGTPLMPLAEGFAKVESKQGYIEIAAKFRNLRPAIGFGAEYLTYVLWAITPEGRAANLGEILIKNETSKLNVTTELQVFGLVVTAEPYFAVRQPSDLVILENELRPDTKGKFQVIDTKYELLKRGQYEPLANPLSLTVDPKIPLELYEARNAVQIARSSGAEDYAKDTFLKAERSLRQAEAYHARKDGNKPTSMLAREAVQTAEDAREIALRRRAQEQLKSEREEAARREAAALAAAREEARRRADEEKRRQEREEAARVARQRAEQEAEQRKKLEAELEQARAAARQAEAEAARAMETLKERTSSFGEERAQWEEERQRREGEESKRQHRLEGLRRAELRVRVYSQLSRVLFTRDTEDGLSVEIPPELFERRRAELTMEGREKLAMVAGILLANAGLSVAVDRPAEVGAVSEGEGGDLRRSRAETVRRYLVERGLLESRLWPPDPSAFPPHEPVDTAMSLTENPVTLRITGETIKAPESLPEDGL